ncbi:uncharacterized protein LOC122887945 isoform X2 [Siniperca chuatsi]|uniref:uncharacterized protein LOC122887945 isoform X2 n=1 Tax=Siniperca chuatsi TaxID=119488 RepID=UPI001CE040D0|nr:uncharacterized protein LOC122887945 isoform X2 [Siniperca chuatsi]
MRKNCSVQMCKEGLYSDRDGSINLDGVTLLSYDSLLHFGLSGSLFPLRCHLGMIGNSSLLAAVLTVVSVASVVALSLLSLLCLRCKKKSKIIHEEHQIYNPQTFQRGGSLFAVTQSKTVTRGNQITTTTEETRQEIEDFSSAAIDEQSDYQNVTEAQTESLEHTYVAPLPITVYENEQTVTDSLHALSNETPDVYANITSSPIKDDEDDYENSEFLGKIVEEQEDDEPDYVNENGDCT